MLTSLASHVDKVFIKHHILYCVHNQTFCKTSQLLCLEEGDPIRLYLQSECIQQHFQPILEELAGLLENDTWVGDAKSTISILVQKLDKAAKADENVCVLHHQDCMHIFWNQSCLTF